MIKTVLKYKDESHEPSKPHTITWLEYVTLMQERDSAKKARVENAAMGMKLMQQAEKIRKLRDMLKRYERRNDIVHEAGVVNLLKETETT